MKLKKIKFRKIFKKKLIRKQKFKHKIMPICFAFLIIIATIFNNFQNYCKAENNKLYEAIKTIMNNNILVQIDENKIVSVNFEEYLLGVLSAEITPNSNPQTLNSQALAAKNYLLFHKVNELLRFKKNIHNDSANKEKNVDIDINSIPNKPVLATTTFQKYIDEKARENKFGKKQNEYEEKFKKAIEETKNLIVVYFDDPKKNEEKLSNTVYCSAAGKITESAKNVWGYDVSYLQKVNNDFENTPEYKSEKKLEDVFNLIKNKNKDASKPEKLIDAITIKSRNDANRVDIVKIFGIEMKGDEIRQILNLQSTNFTIDFKEDKNLDESKIIFTCKGYGHGVGMSQTGANTLAKRGWDFRRILNHYYPNTEIIEIENLKSKPN